MYFGDSSASDIKLGESTVSRIYYGGDCVWPVNSTPLNQPLIRPASGPPVPTVAWWRADLPDTLTSPGGVVSEWRDVVSGRAMVQPNAANRPTVVTQGFGGARGIRFDKAAQQFLEMDSSPWPVDRQSCYLIIVVDQLAPPSDTDTHAIVEYGDTLTGRRGLRREVIVGYERATVAYGNGFTQYAHMHQPVLFHGRHAVVSYVADVNTSLGVDGVFAGLMTLALRTVSGRTRIGANAMGEVGAFSDCIVRDVIIGDPRALFGNHWEDVQAWALQRRRIQFYDNFERPEENLEASPNWSRTTGFAGALRVVNNRVVQETTGAYSLYLSPNVGSPDQYAQAKVISPTDAESTPIIVLRAQNDQNFACGFTVLSGNVYLVTSVAGALSVVGSPVSYQPGDVFRLAAEGNQFRLYRNGETASGPHTITNFSTLQRSGIMSADTVTPFIEDYENAR